MASYIQLGAVTQPIADNVQVTTVLLGCLDCGAAVFDRDAHDVSHAVDASEGAAVGTATN